jgi:hypothetical protein
LGTPRQERVQRSGAHYAQPSFSEVIRQSGLHGSTLQLSGTLNILLNISIFSVIDCSDATENSKKILKIMVRISAYPQVSMILTNPGYQSSIVAYIFETFDSNGSSNYSDSNVFFRS